MPQNSNGLSGGQNRLFVLKRIQLSITKRKKSINLYRITRQSPKNLINNQNWSLFFFCVGFSSFKLISNQINFAIWRSLINTFFLNIFSFSTYFKFNLIVFILKARTITKQCISYLFIFNVDSKLTWSSSLKRPLFGITLIL